MEIPYPQVGALPYRITPQGEVEVLLVTSRTNKRWIIPKGWPMAGLTDAEAAAREAYEEAGVLGNIAETPIGRFTYSKVHKPTGVSSPYEVTVFPMRIDRQLAFWPEADQRLTHWMSWETAVTLVAIPDLNQVITEFATRLDHRNSQNRGTAR